ncbi:hypothetical protein GOEFS_105_00070 [Gordonia effusa NBRC 100432]|uniref:Uncharacterized protein n=1 Tax=Gordonia effusa NBRC 100432 TaxID=1077974 RepID=H0R4J5_9ACTN|nr:hypothetical protein [Gordonia effusa]GAB19996.1 hypothetical protein GOEFS_105_00070 [Gordonia effusa NBRC 100432]
MAESTDGTDRVAELATRLLDAQVAFAKEQVLSSGALAALVTDEVDHFLELTGELTLAEAVTDRQIKDVAHKYAVQLPVEGAIPELVGEIAARIYRHRANDETPLDEVVDGRHFDELLTGAAELQVTQRLIRLVLDSPITVDACVEVVQRAVVSSVRESAHDERSRRRIADVVRSRIARMAEPALPVIESGVDRVARTGARFVLRGNRDTTDEALLESARELWRKRSGDAVGAYRDLVTESDLEDVVVLAFEFWRTFRDTDYFRAMLDEGIAHVFDKYGTTPLAELLAELGIGRDDLVEEGLRFAPSVLATLDERGYLDELLRRRLAPFYSSTLFRDAVAD